MQKNKKEIEEKYKIQIKDETIFLLKNPYDDKFINIDFDLFVDYPKLLPVFLS